MNGYFRKAVVTFPEEYESIPAISCFVSYENHSSNDASVKIGRISNVTTAGFTVEVSETGGTIADIAYIIKWFAIGI
ncbi:H-type lectin domain-containing protein [Faecalicatena contorta]|uniref:H-type lectin domain-containing protein n=1 Tax=Faecalicatena contorta TaxID=39482 RepID=UPI001F214839|nr:H-type lectin domain-containing protein [Faecalicatena contorta]MCF2555741.1 hypothetical protein [Faecalicatena contorta]